MTWKKAKEASYAREERRLRNAMAVFLGALFLILIWFGKDRWSRPPSPKTLVVYGFSIMEEVIENGVFPAFQESWLERTGERVELVATFAGSGAITGKIIQRFPAEVAILSSKMDVLRLSESGIAARPLWKEMPHDGVLTRSPIVILVREGNPRGVVDFADLAVSGVSFFHSDPTTSGGAKWSILAEYASAVEPTGDRELAYRQLLGIWKNVSGQVASAREALDKFEAGEGDALITYEQDVIGNPSRPRAVGEILYPRGTVMTEHTAVKLARNVTEDQQALVDGFFRFLWTREAQEVFVEYGFRSPVEELNQANPRFGTVESPLTLDSLGGPHRARQEIIEAIWRDRVQRELEAGST